MVRRAVYANTTRTGASTPMSGLAIFSAGLLGGIVATFSALRQLGRVKRPAAFAPGEHQPDNFVQHRSAGPDAMRDHPGGAWDRVDQAVDESFPASDPPSHY